GQTPWVVDAVARTNAAGMGIWDNQKDPSPSEGDCRFSSRKGTTPGENRGDLRSAKIGVDASTRWTYCLSLNLVSPIVVRPVGASTGVELVVGGDLLAVERNAQFRCGEPECAVPPALPVGLEHDPDFGIGAVGKSEDGAIDNLLGFRLVAVDR